MKREPIERYDPKKHKSRTDWARVRRLSDRDIAKAVASDPDAAPLLNREWFRRAELVPPLTKKGIYIRLDRDVVEWFQGQGPRYQTRMNAVLRSFMDAQGTRPRGRRGKAGLRTEG
ncbi:MAG: BrnA antitoxin family protein [Gemmatimonadales bacterium]